MTMGEGQGAIDWKCAPPHLYVETLIPSVTVTGVGPLQRWLGHKSEALMNAISAVIEESSICLLPREVTARTQFSIDHKAGPHQTLNVSAPWTWSPQPSPLLVWEDKIQLHVRKSQVKTLLLEGHLHSRAQGEDVSVALHSGLLILCLILDSP